ncbi:hypothetical protein P7K49_030967 [Saguinus oedipus]|uniref:Uncharacterized protein n=1 Tax=Saguinus oedipus TaxID=9490 RepID=A0ABQ9U3N6_SAGOE|nr:hypothetical protein P7K49_030967 [Saguinus oedipus]
MLGIGCAATQRSPGAAAASAWAACAASVALRQGGWRRRGQLGAAMAGGGARPGAAGESGRNFPRGAGRWAGAGPGGGPEPGGPWVGAGQPPAAALQCGGVQGVCAETAARVSAVRVSLRLRPRRPRVSGRGRGADAERPHPRAAGLGPRPGAQRRGLPHPPAEPAEPRGSSGAAGGGRCPSTETGEKVCGGPAGRPLRCPGQARPGPAAGPWLGPPAAGEDGMARPGQGSEPPGRAEGAGGGRGG